MFRPYRVPSSGCAVQMLSTDISRPDNVVIFYHGWTKTLEMLCYVYDVPDVGGFSILKFCYTPDS
jgi:hypothetical protein